MTLGDRVAVMRSGVLQQVGHARGALQRPGEPVRRRLHRLTGDELHARRDRRATRCGCRSATCPLPEGAAPRGDHGANRDRRYPARVVRGRLARG